MDSEQHIAIAISMTKFNNTTSPINSHAAEVPAAVHDFNAGDRSASKKS